MVIIPMDALRNLLCIACCRAKTIQSEFPLSWQRPALCQARGNDADVQLQVPLLRAAPGGVRTSGGTAGSRGWRQGIDFPDQESSHAAFEYGLAHLDEVLQGATEVIRNFDGICSAGTDPAAVPPINSTAKVD